MKMAAATSNDPKQQWGRCTAIPASKCADALEAEYCSYYGPGELETYRHTLLQEQVRDAKLKIWYPGVWHRPSPRALFRIHLSLEAKIAGEDVRQIRFISNSPIISSWLHQSPMQCHEQIQSLQWHSKLMRSSPTERVYEYTLLLHQSHSSKYLEDDVRAAAEDLLQNLCIIIELDTTKEDDNQSCEVSEDCDVDHVSAPPCMSISATIDSISIDKIEWSPILSNQILTCIETGADNFININVDGKNELTASIKEYGAPFTFPHQQQQYKISTIYPTTLERTKEQTPNEIFCDFDEEILGFVKITIPSSSFVDPPIQLRVGETYTEAMNDEEEHFEQSVEIRVDKDDNTIWLSSHLLAFRYVRIIILSDEIDADTISITCQSQEALLDILGSLDFGLNTSDENSLDSKIWDCAAATFKLCLHENFIVDGIKRDRLPWLGDVVVSLMANAYSFHDADCIRWTLSVLGRCGMEKLDFEVSDTTEDEDHARLLVAESHVNGIVDYSLFYFICHWLYQLYFGDESFLQQEWPLLEKRLISLIKWCCDKEKGWFVEHEQEWTFIDWTVEGDKTIPLQIIWWWSLDCAHDLANSVQSLLDCDEAKRNLDNVIELIKNTRSKLETSFLESEDEIQKGYKRHAHLLGAISGLYSRLNDHASGNWWDPDTSDERLQLVKKCRKLAEESRAALLGRDLADVATPYMKHLETLALVRLVERVAALDQVRKYWGGMLDTGATTFYEAFKEGETISDVASFYDRPFARSLCHAWSTGPCALYPEILLGIRPLSVGWKEWTCSPQEGISTVTSAVDTRYGTIRVQLDEVELQVSVPPGTTMKLMNKIYQGGLHCIPRNVLISSELAKQWSNKYRGWHYQDTHVIPPNPIIAGHDGIEMTDVPTVFQLPNDTETYYMTFIGFDGVGYQSFIAESTDLVEWTNLRLAMGYGEEGSFDHGGVVLGAYLYESYHIDAPRTLKKTDSKFFSLYGAYAKKNEYEADPGYQGLASSLDGIYWQGEKDESILSIHGPGIVGDWEKHSIYQPWLVEHDGVYYNFYNAKQMPQWIEQIGIATTKCLHDEWERHTDNPIMSVTKEGYDTQFCSDAKVFWDEAEQHWVMFYYGVGRGAAHIMIAFSRDLIHWERDATPLYPAGGNGLDKKYAHKVSIVYNPKNETFYLFYCAVGDEGRGIGLITSKPI